MVHPVSVPPDHRWCFIKIIYYNIPIHIPIHDTCMYVYVGKKYIRPDEKAQKKNS